MEPIINSQLPEFKVQAFQNGNFKTVTNEDVLGKWAIFFFYPADFTFVCPTELVDMAEKYEQFKSMGVEIYSVSTDSHFVHKAWHDASETIKIADKFFEEDEINRIAMIAPNIILNIIRDYEVVEKKTVTLPDELIGLVKCNNPKCITNNEPMLSRFHVIDKEKGTIKCHYCERKINKEDIIIK